MVPGCRQSQSKPIGPSQPTSPDPTHGASWRFARPPDLWYRSFKEPGTQLRAEKPPTKKEPKSHHPIPELNELVRCRQRNSRLTAEIARLICETHKHIAQLENGLAETRKIRLAKVLNFPPK